MRVAKWRQNLGDDQPTGIAVSDCEFHEMEYGPPCPACVLINRKGSGFVLTSLEDLTAPFFNARMILRFCRGGNGRQRQRKQRIPLRSNESGPPNTLRPFTGSK